MRRATTSPAIPVVAVTVTAAFTGPRPTIARSRVSVAAEANAVTVVLPESKPESADAGGVASVVATLARTR